MKFKRRFYLVLFVLSCIIFGPIMIIGALNLAILFIKTFVFLNFGWGGGTLGILDYLVVGPMGPAGSFSVYINFMVMGVINLVLVRISFYIMSGLKDHYDNSKLNSGGSKRN